MKKIIFIGTPDFAVPSLENLHLSGYSPILVVTQPDKARDRGKKVQFSPVKAKALELGIPVEQPEFLKQNHDFFHKIKLLNPDLIVVVAYGKIIPKELLYMPPFGCINVHGSLLPKYRGAAPIHRAVMEGETETGITLMHMSEGLDCGDMICTSSTQVGKKTTSELHKELAQMGAELLVSTLPSLFVGNTERTPQKEEDVSYAPMVFKDDGHLNFSQSPEKLERLVRAMNSWPGAYTLYQDGVMKVWECEVREEKQKCKDKNVNFGTIIDITKDSIDVYCKDGVLSLTKIQMPGKKPLSVKEYLKGNKIEKSEMLY